jgi:hypothetical protein
MLLEVYVQDGCFGCRNSVELAEWARDEFPALRVELLEFAEGEGTYRTLVTATPTFILDGEIISLGNPSRSELQSRITAKASGSK